MIGLLIWAKVSNLLLISGLILFKTEHISTKEN
jgi:uncharacterized membrane-anchored protein